MATSRYEFTDIKDNYYETFKRIPKEQLDSIDHFEYRLRVNERLDQIAFKNWGDGKLWWIIALINDIGFEFTDMKVGNNIRIPFDVNDVFELLT